MGGYPRKPLFLASSLQLLPKGTYVLDHLWGTGGKNNSASASSSRDAQQAASHLLGYRQPVSSTAQEIKPRAVLAVPWGELEIASCRLQALAGDWK